MYCTPSICIKIGACARVFVTPSVHCCFTRTLVWRARVSGMNFDYVMIARVKPSLARQPARTFHVRSLALDLWSDLVSCDCNFTHVVTCTYNWREV